MTERNSVQRHLRVPCPSCGHRLLPFMSSTAENSLLGWVLGDLGRAYVSFSLFAPVLPPEADASI